MTNNYKNWCVIPTNFGDFRMYDTQEEGVRLLSYSPIENIGDNPLIRIHSSCIASEVFGAKDCDCADQLHEAMKLIANEGRGLIIHVHQEGRGHGLSKKIKAVSIMQTQNCDTAESFIQLGLVQDIREYSRAVEILKNFGITSVRLISNNPSKKQFLTNHGVAVKITHTHPKIRPENKDYLFSKNAKLGHTLPLDEEETTGVIQFYHSDQKWGKFSNFSQHAIYLDGKIWATVEHFYQAQKFHNTAFEEVIRLTETPTLAKERAHEFLKIHSIFNWNDIKEKIMYRGLQAKFTQHPELGELLISTENKILVERADTDSYWGDGKDGKGKNRLGNLLMQLRAEFKENLNEQHRKNIIEFWSLDNPLRLLGKGAEGVVFTDEKWVYKSFYDITDKEWNYLKEISVCFAESPMLTKIEFYESNSYRFIRYPYIDFEPLIKSDSREIIDFLKFSKLNNFVFTNIKPLNIIQTQSGIKLVDYGRSFESYTEEKFLNATKRAFLLYKFPTMQNKEFQAITPKINRGENPLEINGWERFWLEVNFDSTKK